MSQETMAPPPLHRLKRSSETFAAHVISSDGSVLSSQPMTPHIGRSTSDTSIRTDKTHAKWQTDSLRPSKSAFWTLPDAQQSLTDSLPDRVSLCTVLGDGKCLFDCFRVARPVATAQKYQEISVCPSDKCGQQQHLNNFVNLMNICVSVYPVELLAPKLLLNEEAVLHFVHAAIRNEAASNSNRAA